MMSAEGAEWFTFKKLTAGSPQVSLRIPLTPGRTHNGNRRDQGSSHLCIKRPWKRATHSHPHVSAVNCVWRGGELGRKWPLSVCPLRSALLMSHSIFRPGVVIYSAFYDVYFIGVSHQWMCGRVTHIIEIIPGTVACLLPLESSASLCWDSVFISVLDFWIIIRKPEHCWKTILPILSQFFFVFQRRPWIACPVLWMQGPGLLKLHNILVKKIIKDFNAILFKVSVGIGLSVCGTGV